MALKAVVETIDSVPEAVRGLYKETDGKFILDVDAVDGFALEDVAGLKSTLGKELTLRKKLEKEVQKFKDIDPDRAREAFARLEEIGNIDPTKEADKLANERLEVAKRQLLEKHAGEITARESKIGSLTKTIEGLLIDQAATAALAEAKGSVELLLPHVRAHARVREQDGRYVVDIIDKDGNARIGNAKGDPMTITDLVQEMRKSDAFGRAFEGVGQSGGGTPPGNGGGGSPQFKRRSEFKTEKERAAFVNEYGLKAYQDLPL